MSSHLSDDDLRWFFHPYTDLPLINVVDMALGVKIVGREASRELPFVPIIKAGALVMRRRVTPQWTRRLSAPPSAKWMATPRGKRWLWSPEGDAWSREDGKEWLEGPDAKEWLETPAGERWASRGERERPSASEGPSRVVGGFIVTFSIGPPEEAGSDEEEPQVGPKLPAGKKPQTHEVHAEHDPSGPRDFDISTDSDGLVQRLLVLECYAREWDRARESWGERPILEVPEVETIACAFRQLKRTRAEEAGNERDTFFAPRTLKPWEQRAVAHLAHAKVAESLHGGTDVVALGWPGSQAVIARGLAVSDARSFAIVDSLVWRLASPRTDHPKWVCTHRSDGRPTFTAKEFLAWATEVAGVGEKMIDAALRNHPVTAGCFEGSSGDPRKGFKGGAYACVFAVLTELVKRVTKRGEAPTRANVRLGWETSPRSLKAIYRGKDLDRRPRRDG